MAQFRDRRPVRQRGDLLGSTVAGKPIATGCRSSSAHARCIRTRAAGGSRPRQEPSWGRVRSWRELAPRRARASSLEERARRPAARPAILAMTQGVKYVRFGRRLQLQIGFHRALQNILNQVDAVLHGSKRFQVSGGDLPEHSIRQAAASTHVQ